MSHVAVFLCFVLLLFSVGMAARSPEQPIMVGKVTEPVKTIKQKEVSKRLIDQWYSQGYSHSMNSNPDIITIYTPFGLVKAYRQGQDDAKNNRRQK